MTCTAHVNVCTIAYMGDRVTARYLEALGLLPLADLARGTGRAYPTLQAYKYGERRITENAARELAAYLRQRAGEFERAAEAIEAALAEEEGNG